MEKHACKKNGDRQFSVHFSGPLVQCVAPPSFTVQKSRLEVSPPRIRRNGVLNPRPSSGLLAGLLTEWKSFAELCCSTYIYHVHHKVWQACNWLAYPMFLEMKDAGVLYGRYFVAVPWCGILPDVQSLMFCFRFFPQRFTKVVGATYGSASQQLANDLKCHFSAFSGHDAATSKSRPVSPP